MNTAATPVIEYRVETHCGRIISYSATDSQDLVDRFKKDYGLSISVATPYAQWEALQDGFDGFEQLELNAEHEGADAA